MIENLITPKQALKLLGKQQDWVADQMEIHKSYLSRLVNGRRPWTPELKKAFSLTIGLPEEAICFTSDVHIEGRATLSPANSRIPAEPAPVRSESGLGASETSDTTEAENVAESAKTLSGEETA